MLFEVRSGKLKKGDSIFSCAFGKRYEIFEVGIMHPEFFPLKELTSGMIGYLLTNMKQANEARIGDTFHLMSEPVPALPGF
jgi:GTP-binding protein LepA